MKVILLALALFYLSSANGETSEAEIEDLKKRLGIVKQETLRETRRLTEVRKTEVRIMGEEAADCVNSASTELEQSVEAELEKRIGPLQQELDEGKHQDRELLKKKIEDATVKAGVAVEEKTLQFVQKANSCNEKVTGASFRRP